MVQAPRPIDGIGMICKKHAQVLIQTPYRIRGQWAKSIKLCLFAHQSLGKTRIKAQFIGIRFTGHIYTDLSIMTTIAAIYTRSWSLSRPCNDESLP
jgi:hypothetical protein